MSIVVAEGLAKSYGAQDVFWDVSFRIARGDRIALVGPNGVGKTTLLKLIAGLEAPTAGRIHRARRLRIGYLPQEAELAGHRTLRQEMLTVFADLRAQEAELRRLEREMADPARRDRALKRYGKLLEEFELAGGYDFEHRIDRVLTGLGFREDEHRYPLAILSGGQKTRALLAKLLLQEPDLLLLDEPTNHLDLAAMEWLEDYLSEWKGSFVVAAHDRYFLDKLVERVWELGFGHLEQYPGNYSRYVQLRAERLERREAEYRAQQEYIAKTEAFIRRYRAGQRAREARGRQKRLAHLQRLERPRRARTMKLSIETDLRGGDLVLTTKDLAVGYRTALFTCPDLCLRRGERAALVGPNGSGKTTFLKTIVGQVRPLRGEVRLGHNVRVGYLAQAHEGLNRDNTILEEILEVRNLPLQRARTFLGRFLFSGDDVFKRVGDLSGGERSRVALARLTLEGANFLLLDEPTNQLDIPSREVLEEVLADFEGTILLVSHDRYLINALATQVWIIEDGGLNVYQGDYADYLKRREKRERKGRRGATKARERKREKEEARVAELEEAIAALEARLADLGQELAAASQAQDLDRLRELGSEYKRAEGELERLLAEWAEAAG